MMQGLAGKRAERQKMLRCASFFGLSIKNYTQTVPGSHRVLPGDLGARPRGAGGAAVASLGDGVPRRRGRLRRRGPGGGKGVGAQHLPPLKIVCTNSSVEDAAVLYVCVVACTVWHR